MRLPLILAISILSALLAPGPVRAFESSVVRVIVTYQTSDPMRPWLKSQPGVRHGYGILVGESKVLTTEDLTRNHGLVELQKALSGQKYTAKVELSDVDANLSLLKIVDPAQMGALKPLELAGKVPRDAELTVVQFDETGEIQRGAAHIVKIWVAPMTQTAGGILGFKILTDLNVNGQGAAAIYEGKVVGLVTSYDTGARTGTLLPSPVLKHFLDDASGKQYKGFATAGYTWAPLVDPAKRAFLGVKEDGRGVLLLSTLPGTGAAEALRSEDVLLSVDGHAVDNMGFYNDAEFGRLSFPYLIKGRRYAGDVIPVEIIREQKRMTVDVRLTSRADSSALVPEAFTERQSEYLVEGGMVIRELTGQYLQAYGSGWGVNADSRLVHLYLTRATKPENPGEHIVILSHVLHDPINVGYQHLQDMIVTHLNGVPVHGMADVFKTVDRDGGVRRLSLKSIDIDLVLDQSQLKAANARIADKYQIPRLRYERKTE